MTAPKGNKNAARPGTEKAYRVRVKEADDHRDIGLMDTTERGIAMMGYLLWKDELFDEGSFIKWMEKQVRKSK